MGSLTRLLCQDISKKSFLFLHTKLTNSTNKRILGVILFTYTFLAKYLVPNFLCLIKFARKSSGCRLVTIVVVAARLFDELASIRFPPVVSTFDLWCVLFLHLHFHLYSLKVVEAGWWAFSVLRLRLPESLCKTMVCVCYLTARALEST